MTRNCLTPAVLVAMLAAVAPAGANDKPKFEKKVYTDAKKEKLPYRLLLPDGYDAKKKYPLVLFLHGSGERGTDNEKQLGNASKLATDKLGKAHPCFVLAPQCADKGKLQYWAPTVDSGLVLGVLREVEKIYSVDATRIYVTGLSDGGYGVWALLAKHPEVFAGAVPICGWGDPKNAKKMVHVPIWMFHGAKDNVEPVKSSREMVAALKKAGGNLKYTEFPNEGHPCWDKVYADPKVFDWLFDQKRK